MPTSKECESELAQQIRKEVEQELRAKIELDVRTELVLQWNNERDRLIQHMEKFCERKIRQHLNPELAKLDRD